MKSLLVAVMFCLLAAAFAGESSASPWCGTVAADDRAPAVAGHPIRVLYATATDGADNSAALAPRIAADVEEIQAWWQREDSSRKPRFDLAAFPCGAQPDIGRLRLPRGATELSDPDLAWTTIRDTLAGWPLASLTKFVVYYDGPAAVGHCGVGGGSPSGFGVAVILLAGCPSLGSTATVAAHELVHAFGAVPRVGPSSNCPDTPAHVCDSSGDIMYPWAQPAPLASFQLDVGRNDYYGHTGSWLDAQDSPWLQRLDGDVRLDLAVIGKGAVQSDVPGVDCSAACSTDWNPGTQLVLIAVPAPDQVFVGWRGACLGDTRCRLSLDSATKVTATFAPDRFRLSVKVAGRGSVSSAPRAISCPARCSAELDSFSTAELSAKPAKGWRFVSWSGACRGRKASCELELTGPASVRASFVRVRRR